MPLIEGFVHREELAEIVSRWTVDRLRPGDARRLIEIVNFNYYSSRIWVDDLARRVLRGLHGAEPRWTRIQTKGQLKDFAVAHPSYTNPRIDDLIARYRRFPEDFYRETPVDGGFYTLPGEGGPHLVGSSRIKRSRRIAEKGARRMVDFILDQIRRSADGLALERAQRLGVPLEHLITSHAEMVEEFRHAERRVIKRVKQGTILGELDVLPIPDVVGIKLIVEDQDYPALRDRVLADDRCRLLEEELHRGDYNAINMRIAVQLPRSLLSATPPTGLAAVVLAQRGLGDEDALHGAYRTFLNDAEDEVHVEIIVSSFREFMESEIGRSMHEERVLSQRTHPDYTGHLATNVRYLMDYVFAMCRCPGVPEPDEVPIKLWIRYMPETIEQLLWGLFVPHGLTLDAVDVDEGRDPGG